MRRRRRGRDPYEGWTFLIDPETHAHYVRTPEGVERLYDERTVAEELVNLLFAVAAEGTPSQQAQLDLWRRVCGEQKYQEGLDIVRQVSVQYGDPATQAAELFERAAG